MALTVNIVFFNDYAECVYICDSHMPAGMDDITTPDPACSACPAELDWKACASGTSPVSGARMCADEPMPGALASFASMMIIVPIYMTLTRAVRLPVNSVCIFSRIRTQSNCMFWTVVCMDARSNGGGHALAQRRCVASTER